MQQKKRILLLATGGTIASRKSDNGLKPQITPEELIEYIPQVKEICDVEAVQLLNLDSTNMEPSHWKLMVHAIWEHYDDFDGFVIAHGTDTMAYTAAALSYMVQNTKKPIVITGAQKPIDLEITDAKSNLIDSFLYAADDRSQGVQIVFDGKVIAGTRAKKVRSKSYNAFSSIDYPSLAVIQDMNIMRYIPMLPYEEEVRFYEKLDENVFLMKLIPGIRPKVLKSIFENYDCIIVESFGVGRYTAVYRRGVLPAVPGASGQAGGHGDAGGARGKRYDGLRGRSQHERILPLLRVLRYDVRVRDCEGDVDAWQL